MRLRFWRWAHDRAEKLWHWIYYNRLPEGIAAAKQSKLNSQGSFQYTVAYVSKDGTTVPASSGVINVEINAPEKDWREYR
jgi:hypothetical protein